MDQTVGQFIAGKLLEDIDIEEDTVQIGKAAWADFEIEDNGEVVAFVNLYSEIPLDEIREFAFEHDMSSNSVIDEAKILTTNYKKLVVKYVFNQSEQLVGYDPELDNIEVHNVLSEQDDSLIIDINLIAKPVGGKNE